MYRYLRFIPAIGLALTTAACVSTDPTVRPVLIDQPAGFQEVSKTDIAPTEITNTAFTSVGVGYDVVTVSVTVPDYLVSTEADTYKPVADIVWHEDPIGDRHDQAQKILSDALTVGVAPFLVGHRRNGHDAATAELGRSC